MKKIITSVMASAFIFNVTAQALLIPTYSNDFPLGEGLDITQVVGFDENSPKKANIITYMPNQSVTPIIVYKDQLYNSKMTITDAENYLEAQGYHVVGGINGDFYTLSNGVPAGLVINNGEMISSDSWQSAIGFKADGTAVIGEPQIKMHLYFSYGDVPINYYNKVRTTSGSYLLDSNFNSNTVSTMNGTDVILERLDDTPLTPTCEIKLKVVDILETNTPTELKENQFVYTVREEIIDKMPNLTIGEEVYIRTTVANTEWAEVDYAIGANEVLIADGVIPSGLSTVNEPRSAVGVKADGTVVLYQVDGRQTGVSEGMSLVDVAEELLALGCVDAVNLDGGGSSSVIANFPGYADASVTNIASGGSLRQNANYLMFVSQESPTGTLDKLQIYTESELMLKNAQIAIDVKGIDENYYPVTVENVELSSESGTFEEQIFTATEFGIATINANIDDITTSETVTVLEQIDDFSVTLSGQTTPVSTIYIEKGSNFAINVSSTYKTLAVKSAPNSYTYEVVGDVGTINENGVFTAADTISEGSLIVSYGNVSKEFPIEVGLVEEPSHTILFDESEIFTSDFAEMTFDQTDVINGENSLKIDYSAEALIVPSQEYVLNQHQQYINLHAKGDASEFYLIFSDENGENIEVLVEITDEFNEFAIEIPENATKFVGMHVKDSSAGTIFIDDMKFTPSANDKIGPEITMLSDISGEISELNVALSILEGQYSVDSDLISVTLNGDEIAFAYNNFTGELTIKSTNLLSGINKLTISSFDKFGNETISSYDLFTMENEIQKFVDIADHWAKPYINYADQQGIVTGEMKEIANGETIEEVYYFNPNRNMTRAEFAVVIARLLELPLESIPADVPADTEENPEEIPSETADTEQNPEETPVETSETEQNPEETPVETSETEQNPDEVPAETSDTEQNPEGTPVEEISYTNFTDENSIPDWALPHIKAVSDAGIMNGTPIKDDLFFNPHSTITRAEVITVLGRILEDNPQTKELTFIDNSLIPSWSYEYFEKLYALEIIDGYTDNTIKPLHNITRAEVSKLIYAIS